jgi:hypothetical protein
MTRIRDARGQAAVLTVMFVVGLLGMAALVLDVGAWFHDSRASQAAADAAALAGAQSLPGDPSTATGVALSLAGKNGGGLSAGDIQVSSGITTNDTITVKVKRTSPSFFAKLIGIDSVGVDASAAARTGGMSAAKDVAPIGVPQSHPDLSGPGCPCFDSPTELDLGKAGVPGAFHLINLDTSAGGTTGASTIAQWIQSGLDAYLPLGGYFSDTGAKWNSSSVNDALSNRIDTDLLFPVYDTIVGTGSNAQYHVVGWAAFHLTSFQADGINKGTLWGYFRKVLWEGIQATTGGGGGPDYGVYTVQLIQ